MRQTVTPGHLQMGETVNLEVVQLTRPSLFMTSGSSQVLRSVRMSPGLQLPLILLLQQLQQPQQLLLLLLQLQPLLQLQLPLLLQLQQLLQPLQLLQLLQLQR